MTKEQRKSSLKNFTVNKKNEKKSNPAYNAGVLIGWAFIFGILFMVFHSAIVVQKYVLGLYDMEDRIERLEQNLMEKK